MEGHPEFKVPMSMRLYRVTAHRPDHGAGHATEHRYVVMASSKSVALITVQNMFGAGLSYNWNLTFSALAYDEPVVYLGPEAVP